MTPVRPSRPQRGFTLLELLVASALLAVLAVIGWRGLDSVLRAREGIVRVGDDTAALTVAFAQLDEDLRRSWPVRLLGLAQQPLRFEPEAGQPALRLLREGGAALEPSRLERISYRLVQGRFERGFAPLLVPGAGATDTLPLSDAPLVWQPLLEGVAGVQWRAFVPGRGWVDGALLAADPTAGGSIALAGSAQGGQVPAVGGVAGLAGQPAAPAAGAVTGAATAAGGAASGLGAQAAITGVEIVLLRADGLRFERVFPVTD